MFVRLTIGTHKNIHQLYLEMFDSILHFAHFVSFDLLSNIWGREGSWRRIFTPTKPASDQVPERCRGSRWSVSGPTRRGPRRVPAGRSRQLRLRVCRVWNCPATCHRCQVPVGSVPWCRRCQVQVGSVPRWAILRVLCKIKIFYVRSGIKSTSL